MADLEGFRVHPVSLDELGSASCDAAQDLGESLGSCGTIPVPPPAVFGNLAVSREVHRAFAAATERGRVAAGSLTAVLRHDVERLAHTAATYTEHDDKHGSLLRRLLDSLNPLD